MLQSIHLKDFKSFVDEEVALAPLTILVGANASGKSNLLDAIRFVQGRGLGYPVRDVLQGRWEAGREVWKGLRGGVAETIRHGCASAHVSTTWRLDGQQWRHHLEFAVQPKPFIREVKLAGQPPLPAAELMAAAHEASGVIDSICRKSLLLTLAPDRMRGYAPKQAEQELGAEGEYLSSTLWSLCRDARVRQEWVDWLAELVAPDLADVGFIETEIGDVMLALVEKDGTRTSARALSDGTLRFLGMLVALRTAHPGSFVLLEEPETGLHPQRIHLLVEYMEAVTKARGIQVIATTHSPQLLQSLSPESLRDTVLCARTPEHPGTLLRRLGDLPHFDEVSTRSSIDHLFSTGWLERAL